MFNTDQDAFGLGGRQDDDADARVLALFHDWLGESRALDRHSDDENRTEYDAALERREGFETEIISIPGGATASAIKSYLYIKGDACNDWAPEDATLRHSELFDGEPNGWSENIVVSILRDAAKQVPLLADLVAPIIHEDAPLIDADIGIRWCREVLADQEIPSTPAHVAEIREKLNKLLDRIATTEAKTPRGDEIKRRHAPIDEPEKAELRARAEALAAEYGGPLPEGDAGLIEAERRFQEVTRRTSALYDEFQIDYDIEQEMIVGIVDEPVRDRLWNFIEQTPPVGLAGAAVKLRLLSDPDVGLSDDNKDAFASLQQVVEFVEREARP